MSHHILISAIGTDRNGLVREVTKTVLDCGCNIAESRMATMGAEFVMLILATGNWHTLSKLEDELNKVGTKTEMQIAVRRTEAPSLSSDLVPYAVDLVCLDQPGIVNTLASFFSRQNISISEMTSRTYSAAHTGAQMFDLQMILSVPSSTHIATLREDFMDLCDQYNLDAVLDPVKT